jgi:predicted metal-dependent hydrolase
MQNFEYQMKISRRARNLRVSVYRDLKVVITLPEGFQKSKLEKFLQAKSAWVQKSLDYFKKHPALVIKRESGGYKKHKIQALDLINRKIIQWNGFYNFSHGKVNIKNQKTRWGSCSKKGNLNFNYKVIFLPENLLDYLVVHELCHLKEFNHSKRFWELVFKALPDFVKLRKDLRNSYISLY